jgi:hypothetical protein
LRPRLASLSHPFQVSRYQRVVEDTDIEPLPITRAIAQLPGSGGAFRREIGFIEIRVDAPQPRVRNGELRIDFDGAPEKG